MIISCRTLTENLTARSEGGLSRWQRFKVWLHLKLCGPCKTYAAQMSATVAAARALKDEVNEEPRADVRDALVAAFRKRTHGG